VAQFRKNSPSAGSGSCAAVDGIAASEAAVNIAIAADDSPYYNEPRSLASAHGLGLLELVAGDGTIVSSAEWPARFGYQEDWLREPADWESRGAFLRREELPDGVTLALVAVGTASAGGRQLYVAGGSSSTRIPLQPGAAGRHARAAVIATWKRVRPLSWWAGRPKTCPASGLSSSRYNSAKRAIARTLGSGVNAETFHACRSRLSGDLLGVLLMPVRGATWWSSSRSSAGPAWGWRRPASCWNGAELWATARVTRPCCGWRRARPGGGRRLGRYRRVAFLRRDRATGARLQSHDPRTGGAARAPGAGGARAAWRELARRLAHELKNPLFPLQITVENMQRARARYPEQFDEVFAKAPPPARRVGQPEADRWRFSDFAKMPAPEMQR